MVQGTPEVSTAVTSDSPAGRYPIAVGLGSLSTDNYDFELEGGQLTVHPGVVDVRVRYGTKSLSLLGLGRDLPFSTIDAIDLIFSDDVAVSPGELSLTGSNVPSYGLGGVTYDPATKDATWTLPTAIGVDRLLMALDGAAFAGDPTIGVSHFGVNFDVLPGDFNGDGMVTGQDLVGVREQVLGTGDPSLIGWADIDGNGVVNLIDYVAVRKRLGTRLPS